MAEEPNIPDYIKDPKLRRAIKNGFKLHGKWPESVNLRFKVPTEIAVEFFQKFKIKNLRLKSDRKPINQSEIVSHLMWLWASDQKDVDMGGNILNQFLGEDFSYESKKTGTKGRPRKDPEKPTEFVSGDESALEDQ